MNRVPLKIRLLINTIIFAIPIIVLTVLMYSSETVNIDFAQKELLGSQMQKPYEQILKRLAFLKLNKSGDGLDKNLEVLIREYKEIGDDLSFNKEGLATRKREIASLENLQEQISKKNWEEAINSVKASIAQLGDTSNLILDPDLDSYYLMDITLVALPQMQDRIATILKTSQDFFSADKISDEAKIQAALFANDLESADLSRIAGDMQTAVNEDKNFNGISPSLQKNLPEITNALSEPVKKLIADLRKISKSEKIDKAEYFTNALKALDLSFSSWDGLIAELDVLLNKRIEVLKAHRAQSILYSSLALLVTILLSIYIGFTISNSITSILKSVLKLKDSAVTSSEVSTHLKSVSTTTFDNITKQAAAIEETAASVEEINSMLKVSADNSKEASSMAHTANEFAIHGEKEITAVLESMRDIAKSSQKIVETISVIDDIAFQTNLLALNASVEAARAGEQGKGFAVVAEAVRSLAQKSATSAKEINELLNSNVDLIKSSQQKADQASTLLKNIVTSIQKVSSLSNEIAVAAQEQALGLSQISKGISQFEYDSIENQKGMDSVSSASNKIMEQANNLKSIIISLELEIRGKSTHTHASDENSSQAEVGA